MDLSIIVNYLSCFIVFLKINRILCDDEIITVATKAPDFTCAHCATAKSVTNQRDVLDALEQFLDVRGGIHYPYDAIDSNCNRPRNITSIRYRRKCMSNFCYAVTFRDNQGIPLTLRGCADYYMPIANLKTNYCKRLTKSLDIVECVCKGGDSCSNSSSSSTKIRMTTVFSLNLIVVLLSYFAFLRL